MNTDFRISTGFHQHWKTKLLRKRLSGDGIDALIGLWSFAAQNKSSGRFEGMPDLAVELAAGWEGEPGALLQALLELCFLERDATGVLCLHDWTVHNPYAAHADWRHERAKKAAETRYDKPHKGEKIKEESAISMLNDESSIASSESSIAPSPTPTPTPTPAPAPAPTPAPAPVPAPTLSSPEREAVVLERVEAHPTTAALASQDAKTQEKPASPVVQTQRTAPRATRLPPDFVVPPDWIAWANQTCPLIDAHLEAAKFCDYWKAASGKNATKHDWQATWRNWIRNAHPPRPARLGLADPGTGLGIHGRATAAAAQRLLEQDGLTLPSGVGPH